MLRFVMRLVVIGLVIGFPAYASAQLRGQLIPESLAAQHGLTRAWFTQAQFDTATSRACWAVLHEGTLFVQNDRAAVQAIDAITGKALWVQQVGKPAHPTLPVGVNREFVAVLNGSRLYVLNRYNGEVLLDVPAMGVPSAGPAVSDRRVYVPMLDGLIVAHRLEPVPDAGREFVKPKAEAEMTEAEKAQAAQQRLETLRLRQDGARPLRTHSAGRPYLPPVVLRQTAYDEYVSWVTDVGHLYIAQVDRRSEDALSVLHRVKLSGQLPSQPVYAPAKLPSVTAYGIVYLVTSDGFVHAIDERSANTLWRFPTGAACQQAPVLVDGRLYVATSKEGMCCLDAKSGQPLWWAADAVQFLSASQKRVYAVDNLDRLLILDGQSGGRIARMPLGKQAVKLVNRETDRIYLVSDSGLVQALREIALSEPLLHNQARRTGEDDQPAEGKEPAAEKPAAKPPADQGKDALDPFKSPAKPKPGAGTRPADQPGEAGADAAGGAAQSGAAPQRAGQLDNNPFGS